MTTAALGGEFEAPTIEGGRVKIKVPEGAQSGKRFRVRSKGMTQLDQSGRGDIRRRGDLYVEIEVETPTGLTAEQKDLLHQFCDAGGGEGCSPQHQGFFHRAKQFWENVTEGR